MYLRTKDSSSDEESEEECKDYYQHSLKFKSDEEVYEDSGDSDSDSDDEERECTVGEKVENLLGRMRKTTGGLFTTSGSLENHPGLEIKTAENSYTPIGLPLSKPQAENILQYFSKAPFGLGEETKYDDTVRKTWQMEPNQIKLTNPVWNGLIQDMVQKDIKLGLDIGSDRKIKANLFKLLLYDEGSHFNFHKDTEKEPDMFGTLVIQLPSHFTGGKLIVKQDTETVEYECSSDSSYACKYFGFYADCEQLNTFNDEIDSLLVEWRRQPSFPIFYYILDHDYTKLGLKFKCLKGRDLHIYYQLSSYISSHPRSLSLYLGIITQNDYYEEEDDSMELKSSSIYISKCVDMRNKEVNLSKVDKSCIIPHDRRSAFHNKSSEESGPQGNEAATEETTYHTACLILSPKKNFIRARATPLEHLDKLMQRKDPKGTRQFFRMIINLAHLPCDIQPLVSRIVSFNDASIAAFLLKQHRVKWKLFTELETKFGVEALNLMEAEFTTFDDDWLRYIVSLKDKELLVYYVCSTLPNEEKNDSIFSLLEIIEEYNLKISKKCIPACKKYICNHRTYGLELKLKIATRLKDDEVTKQVAEQLCDQTYDLVLFLEGVKILTSSETFIKKKLRYCDLMPLLCSMNKLNVSTHLEQTKLFVIAISIELLTSSNYGTELYHDKWALFFEFIVEHRDKFNTEFFSKLTETIGATKDLRFLEYIQKGFIELSSLKGNEYLKEDEVLVSILKCIVQKTQDDGKFCKVKELVESIEDFQPPQKKLKQ